MACVPFTVDLRGATSPLHHPWQWCVGSDHATTALRADWQAQLAQARRDLGFRHVRFHGLLDDDMGTLVVQNDRPVYSFFNADCIVDFLLSIGMKPVVELSFMPRCLSSGNDIVFHYQGNVTPPRDLAAWAELVRRLAAHWVERYGIDEVASWSFEVWNEPNLRAFWTGTQADYFALYDATARALKGVDPRLAVGGPATAANGWLPEFLAHCAGAGSPVDFVSTHYYPTDAFGVPGSDTETQLEHAPDGIMRTRALEARAAVGDKPLRYTEWSISSNPRDPLHDGSFAAALATRILLGVDGVVDGYSWWTFTDIFEENYFPSVPYHGGFGLVNLHGVPKPVYRALELLRALGDERFATGGAHATVALWAARPAGDASRSAVLVVNQAMPRHPIAAETVSIALDHAAGRAVAGVTVERVDADHANPRGAWERMGSPESLRPADVAALHEASRTVAEPLAVASAAPGRTTIEVAVAPQSVNLLRLHWVDA